MVTPAARREAIAILVERYELSERRAGSVIGADRTSIRCRSRRPEDHDLRERLRALASERHRLPYLSHRVRYNFFRRLSERQIEARNPVEHGPLTIWLRLAGTTDNHNGLIRTLTDRLGETAG